MPLRWQWFLLFLLRSRRPTCPPPGFWLPLSRPFVPLWRLTKRLAVLLVPGYRLGSSQFARIDLCTWRHGLQNLRDVQRHLPRCNRRRRQVSFCLLCHRSRHRCRPPLASRGVALRAGHVSNTASAFHDGTPNSSGTLRGWSRVLPRASLTRCGRDVRRAEISMNLSQEDSRPQLPFDGRVVLTSSSNRQSRRIDDIVTWMEAFSVFSLALMSYYPHRWRTSTAYLPRSLALIASSAVAFGFPTIRLSESIHRRHELGRLVGGHRRPVEFNLHSVGVAVRHRACG